MNKISCRKCGQHLEYEPAQAGREIACPACQTRLTLPGTAATSMELPKPARKPFSPFTIIYVTLALLISAGLGIVQLVEKRQRARESAPPVQTAGDAGQQAAAPGPAPVKAASRPPLTVIGTFPEGLLPASIESLETTFYHRTNPDDDVGEIKAKVISREIKENTFSASYDPPVGGSYRAEVLVRSAEFVPLMGQATFSNRTVTAEFVPLLAKTNAVHLRGRCVDADDESPVPFAGIYLDANKTLTARADEQGQFECFLPSRNGRASCVLWLRTHVGRGASVIARPGEERELVLKMKKRP